MPNDRHRPTYHFSPDAWMNDPIPFFFRGEYHIFFQYNPNGAFWGTMHWGHVVSRDLLHWETLPVALTPTPGGPDADGCFTGCVVEHAGLFYLFYTGIPQLEPLRQVQLLATSHDLISWTKHPDNPIIREQPAGFGDCFRDPHVWREGDGWYMVVGSELPGGAGGVALLYRSDDLIRWDYLHPLTVDESRRAGHQFECPDFFSLNEPARDPGHPCQVLLTSSGQTYWHSGPCEGSKFAVDHVGLVDSGAFYAGKTLLDSERRRILWGWIREWRPDEEQRAAGWSGVLSLPRVLSLAEDGTLRMEPVPELSELRGRQWTFSDLTLKAGSDEVILFLDGIEGEALELDVAFRVSDAAAFGVLVRPSNDAAEDVRISYDPAAKRFADSPMELPRGMGLRLTVFIDHSVIEAFANGKACHTYRSYPKDDGPTTVGVFGRGGEVIVDRVDVWEVG